MPNELKDVINTNEDCIDAFITALQGPDILFFYAPAFRNSVNSEGSKIHARSGKSFFRRSAEFVRDDPSPEAYSYLYGFMCHYMLDSSCHPIVTEYQRLTGMTHAKIEREFDVFVLNMYSKSPIGFDVGYILPENDSLGSIISPFYYSAGPSKINRAINDMRRYESLLNSKNERLRETMYALLSRIKAAGDKRDMVATDEIDIRTADSSEKLWLKLEDTVGETVEQISRLRSCIENDETLDDRLGLDFMGEQRR